MYLLSAVTAKQQALGVTDWSRGSPSCRLFLPAVVAERVINTKVTNFETIIAQRGMHYLAS